MSPRKWVLTLGWKHVVGWIVSLYAVFPIL